MDCKALHDRLDQLIDGALLPTEEREARAHAADCSACGSELARAEALLNALRTLPVDAPAEGFETRVLSRATQRVRTPRSARAVVGTLVAACAASVLTFLLVAPPDFVSAPKPAAELPTIAMTVDEPRTINLVFASNGAFEDVSLLVELPDGIELAGYAGRREVAWRTSMRAGKNVLPLELVARMSASGELIARLRRGSDERVFRVFVTAEMG